MLEVRLTVIRIAGDDISCDNNNKIRFDLLKEIVDQIFSAREKRLVEIEELLFEAFGSCTKKDLIAG